MNWTDQDWLILIEKYRAHECLWNPSNPAYRSSSTKSAAWKEIADIFNIPQDETKKKVKALLTSFRRKKAKEGKLFVDVDKKKMDQSKWLAFEHMDFLLERCYQAKNAEEIKSNNVGDESDTESFFNTKDDVFENSDSHDNNLETEIFDNLICSEVFKPKQLTEKDVEELIPKKRPKIHHFEDEQNEFNTTVQRQVVDWTDTNSLLLIEEYRAHECLWNPTHPAYRSLHQKATAWKEISEKFNTSQEDIKKKMNSLLASFRRERAKEGTSVMNMGHERIYHSRWFAFKPLSFLMDRFNPNKIKHLEEANQNNMEVENEADVFFNVKDEMLEVSEIEVDNLQPDILENLSTSSIDLERESSSEIRIGHLESQNIHKLKKLRKNGKSKQKSVRVDKNRKVTSAEKSVVDVFGEYVVLKLKEYHIYVRNTIQHKISEILFQADRGYFDKHLHPQ